MDGTVSRKKSADVHLINNEFIPWRSGVARSLICGERGIDYAVQITATVYDPRSVRIHAPEWAAERRIADVELVLIADFGTSDIYGPEVISFRGLGSRKPTIH